MAGPDAEPIDTFTNITGATRTIAIQKLEEHGGDLNAAINAFFSEGDGNIARSTLVSAGNDDLMDIDEPIAPPARANPMPSAFDSRMTNPFSLLDPHFRSTVFDSHPHFVDRRPYVSHPKDVREIPIEVKGGPKESNYSGSSPIIEDVTDSQHGQGPGIRGTVIIPDDDDKDDASDANIGTSRPQIANPLQDFPSAPSFDQFPEDPNDIEEEMIKAAIEASKREVQKQASTQAGEQAAEVPDRKGKIKEIGIESSKPLGEDSNQIGTSNGRMATGSSSIQEKESNTDEQPLVWRRTRRGTSTKEVRDINPITPSSPEVEEIRSNPLGNSFPSDEWGGISSEEHDEAVMLEAAMFGGVGEATGYRFPYAPHQVIQPDDSFPHRFARPPSPSLQAQRVIREQQDDEYLASLAADREKEIRAKQEADTRLMLEKAARDAILEEEKKKNEETLRKLLEEQELEKLIAVKESSLPQQPESNDVNAVTLLVRMPDGTRQGRRFLRSNCLQSLFDFIDTSRVVKPGSYRLVRPYPRRAFTKDDFLLTLNELGLTGKQEALFLELI